MKQRQFWLNSHRTNIREWLLSKGFVLSTDGVDLYREWPFFSLAFQALNRHPLDMGCEVIIGYETIGICETLADVQRVYDTIRRINGHSGPEE